jgi:hypothetical protein
VIYQLYEAYSAQASSLELVMPSSKLAKLTEAQRLMYNAEKEINFRWIAKVFATRSSYVLSETEQASSNLVDELSELGQFAEVAYGFLPFSKIFNQYDTLSQAGFPLDQHGALKDCHLISSLDGNTAELTGYVALRPQRGQLIVAFSGTRNWKQALYDVHASRCKYPFGRGCKVHRGFWALYCGIRRQAIEGIKKARGSCDFTEVAFTGCDYFYS